MNGIKEMLEEEAVNQLLILFLLITPVNIIIEIKKRRGHDGESF